MSTGIIPGKVVASGPNIFNMQMSFYDWCKSVGIDDPYMRAIPLGASYYEIERAVDGYPTYWSRGKFKQWLKLNPEHPERWKYEVGAKASTLVSGEDYWDDINVLVTFMYVFGSLMAVVALPTLFFAPLAYIPFLIIPAYGVYSIINRYLMLKRTWGKR